MLCPEVWNFPPPKIITSHKKNGDYETMEKIVNMNSFYKSAIAVCPDEINTPQDIEDTLLEDTDYYKVFNCPLIEFIDPVFIQKFVKAGKLYCLSDSNNCIVDNCFAITPDRILTLHVLTPLFQTLGLEGIKQPHNYYQIRIDLVNLKNINRIRHALMKMKSFNFYISWEPDTDNICPSSIAKYLSDNHYKVTSHSYEVQRLMPEIKNIPTLLDTEVEEIVEWVGMLAIGGDLSPKESYVSTYSEPECAEPLESTRISILIIKGFLTPNVILNTCAILSEYANARELDNYWMSLSIQSMEDSLWQWNLSGPKMFCSQNCSCNIFFCGKSCTIHSVGEIKYS